MKKTTITTLAFVLFFGTFLGAQNVYSSEKNHLPTNNTSNTLSLLHLQDIQSAFLKAIRIRQQSYFRKKYKNPEYNTDKGQEFKHNLSQSKKNVNDVRTFIERGGEKDDRSGIRESNYPRIERINRKQTFRAGVICYYVEGKAPNDECMKSGVIDGQKNDVPVDPFIEEKHRMNIAGVNSDMRDMIRVFAEESKNIKDSPHRVSNYPSIKPGRGHYTAPFVKPLLDEEFFKDLEE